MTQTYCGKNCGACVEKESISCPGCKEGPGRPIYGDCELARCCREKGHEKCVTCSFCGDCLTMRGRYDIPRYRRERQESERLQKENRRNRAMELEKWARILFWLFIPSVVAGVMASEQLGGQIPGVATIGDILNLVITMLYGIILIKMSSQHPRYRTAGICTLVGLAVGQVGVLLGAAAGNATGINLLFTLPAAIVALVGDYQEYMTHSDVRQGIDDILADQWRKFWKWYMIAMMSPFCCALLLMIIPGIALIALLIAALALPVLEVIKIVYLYRTAEAFRKCVRG